MSERGENGTATASGTVHVHRPPAPTRSSLIHKAAEIRDHVGLLGSDVKEIHQELRRRQLDDETALIGMRDPVDVLEELASDYGMAWSTIAKMVGVSDTAVRKWRKGEAVTPENRRRVARASAFLHLLQTSYPVVEPASWLEMPISDEAKATGVDVYIANRFELLFEYAAGRIGPMSLLDDFDPEWRTRYGFDSAFNVEMGLDDQPAIIERRE